MDQYSFKKQGNSLLLAVVLSVLVYGLGTDTTFAVVNKNQAQKARISSFDNNHRVPTKHSSRKAAAKRLKKKYTLERQQKLDKWVNAHQGYTGVGRSR